MLRKSFLWWPCLSVAFVLHGVHLSINNSIYNVGRSRATKNDEIQMKLDRKCFQNAFGKLMNAPRKDQLGKITKMEGRRRTSWNFTVSRLRRGWILHSLKKESWKRNDIYAVPSADVMDMSNRDFNKIPTYRFDNHQLLDQLERFKELKDLSFTFQEDWKKCSSAKFRKLIPLNFRYLRGFETLGRNEMDSRDLTECGLNVIQLTSIEQDRKST
jgi:hypothetical protein